MIAHLAQAGAGALGIALAIVQTSVAGTEAGGAAFRAATTELFACMDEQSRIAEAREESPLFLADRVYDHCAPAISDLSAGAVGPVARRRLMGAIRGAVTDAVLFYEGRMAFRRARSAGLSRVRNPSAMPTP